MIFITQIFFGCLLLLVAMREVSSDDRCTPEHMTQCTDPLTMLTDSNDLSWASSQSELDRMCPKLMDGIACINSFTVRCLNKEQRAYFTIMYSGTIQVIEDLCRPGPYQTGYLRHAPCMRTVKREYQECSIRYQRKLNHIQSRRNPTSRKTTSSESGNLEDVGLLCCSFQEYLDCSMSAVNATCGRDTAVFTKQFLDRMASPLNHGHCQNISPSSDFCQGLSVKFSSSSLSSTDSTIAFTALLFFIVIIQFS